MRVREEGEVMTNKYMSSAKQTQKSSRKNKYGEGEGRKFNKDERERVMESGLEEEERERLKTHVCVCVWERLLKDGAVLSSELSAKLPPSQSVAL